MNLNFVRRLGLSLLASGFAVTLLGQDLIARQAPVDRRLRAVDSIAIQRAVERDILIDPSAEIYNSWVTTKAHPYRSEEVPDSFVIDLRGFAMPTPSRQVTSRFGYRPAFRRMHKGLDIKVYTGDTIVSAFDGKARASAEAGFVKPLVGNSSVTCSSRIISCRKAQRSAQITYCGLIAGSVLDYHAKIRRNGQSRKVTHRTFCLDVDDPALVLEAEMHTPLAPKARAA